ncbi:MAG: DNA adenine methylase [Aestuariivita sp.]|nr:DNA adenine methylase [Aestuariivita sp.]MCY4345359.1 DNA adenine methylase [Aestuariivita sp.]
MVDTTALVADTQFPISRVPVANVASVPQRSPLRYPGGKTWLVPHIREWLSRTLPEIIIEPFTGGGIVSLTAIMEDLASSAVMIEIDHDVAAFWRSALESGATLRDWISEFEPTLDRLREIEQSSPATVAEHGFRTLVLNRTRRGGVLAPGASFCRAGENGKGVGSRWYPETIVTRLNKIQECAARIQFIAGDGMRLLPDLLQEQGRAAAVFIDPPYTATGGKKAGSRLYKHSKVDHEALFAMLAEHECNFLMTYDAAPEIIALVQKFDFCAVQLAMKNGHHNQMTELVITPEPIFA